ncbi:hypothetical protein SPRG_20500 [Saprolegnia parasitica CBS 223.65]|uniref:Uncharacterized protein n=1 Tax=Saprolegnia parasitica (strain CBS 223.65) TaxID=695850 RepID=A0A067CIV6_SAPPC|nr:hypothetical protein SPRG_20500 [Saprolegnia parasitica CBS 223.65]KDO26702.1 hypothetical protein SPRG_20500 [Saprolegnia parasitica CBS 223.65]|eukprot:XP_012202590.1 hypothetical protein SPRG_20500 [Saprolegnia parasitica CBS 223.65]
MQAFSHADLHFARHMQAKRQADEQRKAAEPKASAPAKSEPKNWRQKYLRKLNLSKTDDDKTLRRAQSCSAPIAIPSDLERKSSGLWWEDDRRSSPIVFNRDDENAQVVDEWDLGLDDEKPYRASTGSAMPPFVPPHELVKKESKHTPGNFRKNVVVWM